MRLTATSPYSKKLLSQLIEPDGKGVEILRLLRALEVTDTLLSQLLKNARSSSVGTQSVLLGQSFILADISGP